MAVEPTKRICLVAGSTGLIGNLLVRELAKSDVEVIALTRNEYFSENQQVIYETIDFDKKESFEELFKNVTDVFICLGTTINKAGSKESFRKVDVDYSFSIAEAASKASVPNLSVVTSIGADSKSNNFYLKCKGEVEEMISNVGGRMHNEDLDGDIERCWNALRQTTQDIGSSNVPLKSVIKTMIPILESTFGAVPEGYGDDARVSSFIAGLFLTHKGIASITQGNQLDDVIMIEDLWPQLSTFEDVLAATLEADQQAQEARESSKTGSTLHAERLQQRAEKARLSEEKAKATLETEQEESKPDFEEHEWLVE